MTRDNHDIRVLVLVAAGLFVLSSVVRFCLADFPKCIGVLPDEIRYLNLAASLFNEGQLIERGGFSSFQKILYPLALSPAFLADDPLLRVRLIALLNSIYVSSAVFPALLLARRLFTGKAPVIICLLFALIMPDMCYSMTFLSECIYLPLALWLIACCLRAFEARGRAGYAWCAGAGLLCYVTYLAKEVALGFALASIVVMIVRICRAKDDGRAQADDGLRTTAGISSRSAMSAMRSCEDCLSAPEAREFRSSIARSAGRVRGQACGRPQAAVRSGIARVVGRVRGQAWLRACLSLACFVVGFLIPFIILKFTLFSGLLNSYNQTDPSVLLNPYALLFAIYALASDATHFVIAFAFFPLALPALTWPRLTRRERDLYLFCLLAFVFILLIVVYTISIREDLGHVGIRPHVRYVAPIFLPLLFLTIKQLLRGDGTAIMRTPFAFAAAIAMTLGMCLLVVFMLGNGDYSQGFDNAQFHPLRLLGEHLSPLPIDPNVDPSVSSGAKDIYHGAFLEINPGIWLAKALVCIYLVFGMWAIASRHHPKVAIGVPVLIALAMIAANVGAYQYNDSVYRIDAEEAAETCAVNEFVYALPDGEQVLVVVDDENSSFNNLMDVYLENERLNCAYILERQLRNALEEGAISQRELLLASDDTVGDNIFDANGRTCDDDAGIAYIVMPKAQKLEFEEGATLDVTPEWFEDIVVLQLVPDASVALVPSAVRMSSTR
ncbi:MAG TPA: hypothetical protein OIM11_05000 [Coriobacteriaceae bacterium]|nr:hypothetical protein [Coriobacteriaceae bacterium]